MKKKLIKIKKPTIITGFVLISAIIAFSLSVYDFHILQNNTPVLSHDGLYFCSYSRVMFSFSPDPRFGYADCYRFPDYHQKNINLRPGPPPHSYMINDPDYQEAVRRNYGD